MSGNMQPTTPPPALNHNPLGAPASIEFEEFQTWQRKRALTTMKDVKTEWNYGSKAKVVKNPCGHTAVGLTFSEVVVIGLVVGVCIHFI